MDDDWINDDAEPNGIGFACRHCNKLIDWHPVDHAQDCPEYRDWCSCGPRCGIPVGVHQACSQCGGVVTWEDFPFAGAPLCDHGFQFDCERCDPLLPLDLPAPEPLPLTVSWDHNADPPVPFVTTIETDDDGDPWICLHDRDDSLRLMWAEIERLRGGRA